MKEGDSIIEHCNLSKELIEYIADARHFNYSALELGSILINSIKIKIIVLNLIVKL